MERKNIIKLIALFLFIIICILFTVFFIKSHSNQKIEHYYLSEMLIYKEGTEYEVLLNNEDKSTWFRVNEDKERYYSYPREGKSRIKIPNMDDVVAENTLYKLKPLSNYTYSVNMEDGFKYLKYLLENGYEIKMYVASPTYYEAFLERDGTVKRLVLFSDFLMMGDLVQDSPLPSLSDYLSVYNYNDYIENKLQVLEQ